ncbi:hypothetical protein JK358_35930 [Nocardia sp. 2]|uniref:HTH luxR-type domain-containing protein n=1 Tax=Nocardia acididurans TaxID=2802282 RepID=A0ABS1MHQ9_9NOCA|nr:AAA family ATPase [Nocardia acididurans]MBL1079806.1 hypothetical protein [Nocardia acididurans]
MSAVSLRGDEVPASTSQFFGREAESETLEYLLTSVFRLITLVGPGGIGKTRLAAETLRGIDRAGSRHVHWVRLARLPRDSASVVEEVAHSVVRSDVVGQSAWDALLGALRFEASDGLAPLLVLDNCEHVNSAARQLITDLLSAVPELTILATSREPVGWAEEYVFAVPPLSPRQSLELLRVRAAIVGRPVPEDPEQITLARTICRRVDHNPLFIRLASARLRHRPLAGLLDELTGDTSDRRLAWRQGVRMESEGRHSGIGSVVEWSFDLCRAEERLLLERLAVFAAGFEETDNAAPARNGVELDAIVAVCANDALPAAAIAPILDGLVEKSLVSTHARAGMVRYYLLESVRLFAYQELFDREAERVRLQQRHRRYYRRGIGSIRDIWCGPEQQAWVEWVRDAWDNILIAIESSFTDPAEALIGLEISTVLISRWIPRGRAGAVLRLTELALDATQESGPAAEALRVRAMALIGRLALWQGECETAAALLDRCAAVCAPTVGDWRASATVDIGLPPAVEWTWGSELMMVAMDQRAVIVLDRARGKFHDAGDTLGEEACLQFLAFASAFVGDRAQALERTRHYLDLAAGAGATRTMAFAEIAHSIALARCGHTREALALTDALLSAPLVPDDMWTVSWALAGRFITLTEILADTTSPGAVDRDRIARELARLVGAFAAHHRSTGVAIHRIPLLATHLDRAAQLAGRALGEEDYADAQDQGKALLRTFVDSGDIGRGAFAAAATAGPGAGAPGVLWASLTRAERHIATYAAAGWTNTAIAAHRRCSVRTVDAQLASVRRKLMITSRNDILRHIPAEISKAVADATQNRPAR